MIHQFAYDASTLALTNETIIANGATNSIARSYDSYGRSDGFAFGSDYAVDYAYDAVGRFAAITSSVDSVSSVVDYSYVQGSDILAGWSSNAGTIHSRTFEPNRALITTVSNVYDSTTVSSFAYENDALGRRTRREDYANGVASTNTFGYNIRSEVTNAVMDTNYTYAYDPIGNRERAIIGVETNDYFANMLNQYTNITDGATYTPEYDSDGNMTNYAAFAFNWNGENRLIEVQSNGVTVVENAYDYQGRRIEKVSGSVTNSYVYDGWNLISEVSSQSSGTSTNYYIWGLDLSQSLQGAGGVGGLLATTDGTDIYYAAYDANGNVTVRTGSDLDKALSIN